MADSDIDEDSIFELGFEVVPTDELPSGRLVDMMKLLEEKDPAVVALDSLIFNETTRSNPEKEALGR